MNRQEHLLTIAAEECAEVAQRIAKALRFGMQQIQEDADDKPEENPERLTNAQRIIREYNDLQALMQMLNLNVNHPELREQKKARVMRYLQRSERCGTLSPDSPVVIAPSSPPPEPQERELCRVCQGNGVVKIHHGVSVCDHCRGECWEPSAARESFTSKELLLIGSVLGDTASAAEESDAEDVRAEVPMLRALSRKAWNLGFTKEGPR